MTIFFFLLLVVYVIIGFYIRHDNKKSRDSKSVFQYKHNQENAYVEYRQWKLVWGLLVDSQKEVNLVIDEWNENGYTCIGCQKNFIPNVSILRIIGIVIITVLTLGFASLYTGPALLFRKK